MFRLALLVVALAGVEATVQCSGAKPRGQPAYCCDGITPNMEFIDTCECNADWSGEECTCKGAMLKNACHSCMVHLRSSNHWGRNFNDEELFENCHSCVDRCQADLKEGMCKDFVDQWFTDQYTVGEPWQTLCTYDKMKSVLNTDSYPYVIKKELFRRPTMSEDGYIDKRFDWDIPGIGHAAKYVEQHKAGQSDLQ